MVDILSQLVILGKLSSDDGWYLSQSVTVGNLNSDDGWYVSQSLHGNLTEAMVHMLVSLTLCKEVFWKCNLQNSVLMQNSSRIKYLYFQIWPLLFNYALLE